MTIVRARPSDLDRLRQEGRNERYPRVVPKGCVLWLEGDMRHDMSGRMRITNLLSYPEDFTNAVWDKNCAGAACGTAVEANAAAAPDGTLTADRLYDAGESRSRWLLQTFLGVVGTVYTFSIWVKKVDGCTQTSIGFWDNVAGWTETSIHASLSTSTWIRFTKSYTVPVGCTTIRCGFTAATNADTNILVWGAQVDVGATARIYNGLYPYPTTISGTTLVTGVHGWGRRGDGIDDVLTVVDHADIQNLNRVTYEVAFKPTGWGGATFGRLFSKNEKVQLRVRGDLRCLTFFRDFDGATDGTWNTPDDSIVLGRTYHVMVSYDKTATTTVPVIVINGVAQVLAVETTGVGSAVSDVGDLKLLNRTAGDRAFAGDLYQHAQYAGLWNVAQMRQRFNAEAWRYGLPRVE